MAAHRCPAAGARRPRRRRPGRSGGRRHLRAGRAKANSVAARLLAAVQAPGRPPRRRLTPRAGIGVSLRDAEIPIDALMHDAGIAVYAAKTGGKSRVVHAHLNASAGSA